jgi:hypothetical protein
MNTLVYLAIAKSADNDGVFGKLVVIDGVGNFPIEQLDKVVSALIELQGQLPHRIAG